jgi:membrane-bound serine protease (ClpP class)
MNTIRQQARLTPAVLGLFLLIAGIFVTSLPAGAQSEATGPDVYIVDISGTIDLGLAPYLDRVLGEAADSNAAAVILEINTPGGRLDAALQMRSDLLGAQVPTVAWVNRDAFSAGALIAIAAEQIYMAPGAEMGAATPVDGAGTPADEKVVSAVRASFRATAEERGRDPVVAEAMVDPAVVVEGLVTDTQILTLTTNEAIEWGYAEGTASTIEDILEQLGIEDANVIQTSPGWAEAVVRFLTNPILASMLFSFGFLLIIADVFSGGIGFLAGAGALMLGLFFWGHFITGLAGWEGVLLVVLGLVLVGVEVFVIPGFGIFGLAGIASVLGGLYLSVQGREIVTDEDVNRALATVSGGFVMMVFGTLLILFLLPKATRFQSLVLAAHVDMPAPPVERRKRDFRRFFRSPEPEIPGNPQTSPPASPPPRQNQDRQPFIPANLSRDEDLPTMVGQRGTALSDLRPGGIATIQGRRVDVVTEGDYIQAGEAVEVILDERYRRVVKKVGEDS